MVCSEGETEPRKEDTHWGGGWTGPFPSPTQQLGPHGDVCQRVSKVPDARPQLLLDLVRRQAACSGLVSPPFQPPLAAVCGPSLGFPASASPVRSLLCLAARSAAHCLFQVSYVASWANEKAAVRRTFRRLILLGSDLSGFWLGL